MRARSLLAFAICLGVSTAHADPRGDIEKKIKAAMESYDLMDYDAAKKTLNQALSAAKKGKLDKDPVAARAYLDLGIVSFANGDQDGAKLSFLSAVQIDSKIQIDPAYKSPELAKLLEEARGETKGGSGGSSGGGGSEEAVTSGGGGGDCGSGLQHTIVDSAKAGGPLQLEATLGSDIRAKRVSIMYRPEGATDFTEVKMKKDGDCKYVGNIPATGLRGSVVHYYVAAYGDGTKPLAQKGSAGSPNIVEITGGGKAPKGGDDEDPLGGGKKVADSGEGGGGGETPPSGGEVDKTAEPTTPKREKVLIGVGVGGGFGFLSSSDQTEGGNPVKAAGFGHSAVITPEIDYKISPQVSIGIVGRFQIPYDANINGHSPIGPAGLLRLRYALDASGEGVQLVGSVGAGILRSTLTLDNATPGMDVDIVSQGPLLIGGGLSYAKHVASSLTFLADFGALAGIAVVNSLGGDCSMMPMMQCARMNSGVTVDVSLGLAFGL